MKTTTDIYTGQRFRWNTTAHYQGVVVPARETSRTSVCLHPDRVPPALLRQLNPNADLTAIFVRQVKLSDRPLWLRVRS